MPRVWYLYRLCSRITNLIFKRQKEVIRMEKQKRWQLVLILAVIVLTLYNILPTVFYYTKPLKQPITAERAEGIGKEIVQRVDSLETDSKEWLTSFAKLLKVKPVSIEMRQDDPRVFDVTFSNPKDADLFKRFLPRAGALIPFVPAQLELNSGTDDDAQATKVAVLRHVGVHLDPKDLSQYFHYSPKLDENGQLAPLYREVIYDRVIQLALGFGGTSLPARQIAAVVENSTDPRYNDVVFEIARNIVEAEGALGKNDKILKRYFSSFSQINQGKSEDFIPKFIAQMETLKTRVDSQREQLLQEQKKLQEQNLLLDTPRLQQLAQLDSQRNALESATKIMRKYSAEFKAGTKPLNEASIASLLKSSAAKMNKTNPVQVIDLAGQSPFVQSLIIDWSNDKILVKLYPDIQSILSSETTKEAEAYQKDRLNQMVMNEIARVSRNADETIMPSEDGYLVNLNKLTGSDSFLAFDLGVLASKQSQQIQNQLLTLWNPKHADLERDAYPIRDFDTFKKQKPEDQKLGLVIYAPSMYKESAPVGFHTNSIYVIAKGLDSIIKKHQETPNAQEEQTLVDDFKSLQKVMQQNGFIGYSGASYGISPEFSKDFIFELSDYYGNLLKATREDFDVKGSKRYAVLDFTNVEQRILTQNKIDDRIQEDLLKWKEEYSAAQVDLNPTSRYTVPAPTKNPYLANFKLSFVKYFRGDDRKILKWGLDLSGGKTVRIGLRDQNNRPITDPNEIKQAVNELYVRINNMGVSERTIRIENSNIILDFPGSQELSAADLIKASAMYFHIINEKFSTVNPLLGEAVRHFLQDVWNEAIVTNRKDSESINEIAWRHLGGEIGEDQDLRPRSEYASMLYANGLRLPNPKEKMITSSFNDTLSSIGMFRGDDFSEWYGQTNPLVVIFHNYALEGSSLDHIQVGYDPSEGNILMFSVKSSYANKDKSSGSPRDDFYAWTSQFSEEKIVGTPKEAYSGGHGWRMAVILNGQIISAPTLRAALRDHASISGRFSQREINQLAADLKAGSLSFTPKILSEENVSPELGREERTKGFIASGVALLLVVVAMIGYYRFAGMVASAAVLFNLLIMWGVLQNIGAALTLPGIAGMVLTIGMAVDANVLVFERIREEFKLTGRISTAIQAGYRKAFSAIVDSNITTIIAALILIQFDSGPIKGFAVVLIIGILSSMFTALFMTRYFFAGWVKNPEHKSLSMAQFIGHTNFDFLGKAKKAWVISVAIMIVGTYLLIAQRNTIFGMDFTGGYSLTTELQEQPGHPNYRQEVATALIAHGASPNDIQIRELSRPNQLRIQIGMGMEQKGHPFYEMPEHLTEGKFTHEYEKDPRLAWVVNALKDAHLPIQTTQLSTLTSNWSVMSGQLSDAMRNNALIALTTALIAILLYITFRFEFKFAIGAVVGLAHDVIITLGVLALFHWLGAAVQIDLQVIGAIMTIIGYSLNDTIIVFDRIREDIRIMRKMKFKDIVNHALNITLSRTLMTSGTTLLVLLALVLLGGHSIFAFSLVMTIGVVFGTLSSLFIAAPVMLYFHDREERRNSSFELEPKKIS